MPMYAVFAPSVAVGALLFRNSVVAYIDALEPVLAAFPRDGRGALCFTGPAAAACSWCPAPVRAWTTCRPNPFYLARAVRVFTDLCLVGLAGLALVSLALMNVSNLTATLNIFILHFEQIKMCIKQSVPEYSFDACQASLLTFYYTLVYTLLWFPLYPLAAHFCRLVYFYFYFYLRTYVQSD